MAIQNFESLRQRVQALGCQLFRDTDDTEPCYYAHDPKIERHIANGPEKDILDWCEEAEKHGLWHRETTAAPETDDERFLQLIVCAGPKDRFTAMDVRREDGVAAALRFLGKCQLTEEEYDPKPAHRVLDEMRDRLRWARGTVALFLDADDELDEQYINAASSVAEHLREAQALLDRIVAASLPKGKGDAG
jgi:hypothetical protein